MARILAGSPVAVGGQDCHYEREGAHTGDISAAMLRDLGARWVILGHSERRQNHAETDELVRTKVIAATEAELTPIVCVGETDEQRQSGRETEVVGWQLTGSLPKGFSGAVAYEPIWAIGTGRTATERDVETMHAFIREELVRQFGQAGREIRILLRRLGKARKCRIPAFCPECRRGAGGWSQLGGWRLPRDRPERAGLICALMRPRPDPC